MIPEHPHRKQAQTSPHPEDGTTSPPAPEPCPRCGTIDVPTLSAGTGPHACKATCQQCGRFIKWVSLLAPSERFARKMKARLEAMRKHPASAAQLALLLALGDTGVAPASMAEASERIEGLKAATAATNTKTLGGTP